MTDHKEWAAARAAEVYFISNNGLTGQASIEAALLEAYKRGREEERLATSGRTGNVEDSPEYHIGLAKGLEERIAVAWPSPDDARGHFDTWLNEQTDPSCWGVFYETFAWLRANTRIESVENVVAEYEKVCSKQEERCYREGIAKGESRIRAEYAPLVEALEFYANKDAYDVTEALVTGIDPVTRTITIGKSPTQYKVSREVVDDQGALARAALAKFREAKK